MANGEAELGAAYEPDGAFGGENRTADHEPHATQDNNKVVAYRAGAWKEVPVGITSDEEIAVVFKSMTERPRNC